MSGPDFKVKSLIIQLILSIPLVCLVGVSTPFAQGTKYADEDAVEAAVESLRLLMITPDKTKLEDLAAEELSYGHSSGTIRDKAGFVDEFVKGWSVFRSITFSDQTIRFAGDIALVRHRLTGDTFNKNVPGQVDIIILLVWQKQNGVWKLLARQAAKIPG